MKPRKFIEAQELLVLTLETIIAVREKFKAEHIVDILKGNETSEVTTYQHDELENFSSASDEDEKTLHAVIRQALIGGLISKEIENYGLLKITPAGKAYLKKPVSFQVVKDTEFDDEEEEVATKQSGGTCAADDVLFSI